MNYYNPYFTMAPLARPSLFSALRGSLRGSGITLGTILNGTQRTLGIINQTIPIVKQVTPMVKNAKTMFRVMNEFKKVETPKTNIPTQNNVNNQTAQNNIISENNEQYEEGPTFFI